MKKAQVLVLGTFHMGQEEGFDCEHRRPEIEALVDRLAEFQPTKIAVEMVLEDSAAFDEQFRQYGDGTWDLKANEIYQIGFRLAKRLGHPRVYPTDWMGPAEMSFGEIEDWANEHQPELMQELFAELTDFPTITEEKTVLEYHKELNNPELIELLHKVYVNVARIGTTDNNVGIKWLSWWYKRNLIMFANLTRLMESPDERILFIVGGSHSSIVTKFLEESDVCEVVPPLQYLS